MYKFILIYIFLTLFPSFLRWNRIYMFHVFVIFSMVHFYFNCSAVFTLYLQIIHIKDYNPIVPISIMLFISLFIETEKNVVSSRCKPFYPHCKDVMHYLMSVPQLYTPSLINFYNAYLTIYTFLHNL